MTENAIGEIVKQTHSAPVEQRPLVPLGEEKPQATEVDILYEEMTSYQMYQLLLENKLPTSAVPLYFQKLREEDISIVTGELYNHSSFSHPNKRIERKFAKVAAVQRAERLAEHPKDPQDVERQVANIEAKYNPLINGTPQDQARYFANEAIDLSLNHKWVSPEDITSANMMVANLYGLASRLSREVVGQATPEGKSIAVVADPKPKGHPAA